ncbi:hypothetical protein GCM10022249_22250 [Enteractinococcus coprophilus]
MIRMVSTVRSPNTLLTASAWAVAPVAYPGSTITAVSAPGAAMTYVFVPLKVIPEGLSWVIRVVNRLLATMLEELIW